MRRYSRVIGNCVGDGDGDGDGHGGGGGGGGVAGDGVFPSPNRRTPDHPPYSEMVSVALQALAEENGSTESSISAYIKSTFNDLPWGHDRLLPYYLRKLVADGELTSPSPDRYQLLFHPPPSISLPVRRRGRPRLYPANPNPSVSPLPSSLHRHRGRPSLRRRRGRPPKIHAEEMAPLQLKRGTPPLRRGRGRLRLRQDDSTGRTSTRRSGLPRSRGSKRRRDSFPVSDTEELNCQSGNSAFSDDIKNRGSECSALVDPEHIELDNAQLELGHPFLAPGQSLLILETGTMMPLLGPEHYEHVEGQLLQGEEQPILAPEKTELSQDKSLLGEKLPLLAPEQGKMPPFLAPELFEHDQVQSMQGEAHPFAAPEQTELGKDQSSLGERLPSFIPEQAKVPPFLALEFMEPDLGQPLQGEAPPFMPNEQTELVQKESKERPPLLSAEQLEHDHGLPLAVPEESEEGHAQMLPEIGTADPKEGELVVIPRPDEEEVENPAVSSKKRKSHGKRRSLRLWFES